MAKRFTQVDRNKAIDKARFSNDYEKVARELGITISTLKKWERDMRKEEEERDKQDFFDIDFDFESLEPENRVNPRLEKKPYNGLRWTMFLPLWFILCVFTSAILNFIPIVWIIQKLFDLGNANPLENKIVFGPVGFLLVFTFHGVVYTIASLISISITSRPKLAWKILWAFHFLPILMLVLAYEIAKIDAFDGNLWYNLANITAAITAAMISRVMIASTD